MQAARRLGTTAGGGLSLALQFADLPGPVLLDDAPEVADGLRQVLKDWPADFRAKRAEDASRAVSQVARDGSGFRVASPWLDEPLRDLPAASAVCAVVADLAQTFYESRPDALALHCGAFLIGGRLVAMTGHAHAGKSTFMARLSAEPDLQILCDDILPLLSDDRAMGLGIAPRLRLPLPPRASAGFRAHVAQHCSLRDDKYGYVSAPTVASYGVRAPLSVLVVLDRRQRVRARLHHLPAAEAVRHLLQQNMAPIAPDAVDSAVTRLLHLADGLVCLRLVYSDLEDAVGLVRAAFGGGIVPDPSVRIHPPLPETCPAPDTPAAPVEPHGLWRRAPGTGMRRIGDEVFLWQPATGEIFHLNPVAGAIWRLLEEPNSARAIAGLLTEAFAASAPTSVLDDTCGLIGNLAAANLVLRTERGRHAGPGKG